ncbi:hypothetical protein ID866_8782 [Astraeus odoratus]|nr:hypothetical protein ID866_8782 [Astraeus odoratus]
MLLAPSTGSGYAGTVGDDRRQTPENRRRPKRVPCLFLLESPFSSTLIIIRSDHRRSWTAVFKNIY